MQTIQERKLTLNPSVTVITGAVGAASMLSLVSTPSFVEGGTVPTDVTAAINNTTATVAALGPIALAAISVALVPFGASMALSFVHKVMNKA